MLFITEIVSRPDLEPFYSRYNSEGSERPGDEAYGPGHRGDELPPDLSIRESRLRKMRGIQKSLQEEKEEKAREQEKKIEVCRAWEESAGKKTRGRKPKSKAIACTIVMNFDTRNLRENNRLVVEILLLQCLS